MIEDGFEEFVVNDGEAQLLNILLELCLGNRIFPGGAIKLLDGQDGFLHFLPDVFLVLT